MPTVETKIWLALKRRLEILPAPVDFPIMYNDDTTFVKPTGSNGQPAPWIRCIHRPNTVQRRFIGSDDPAQRMGLSFISLFYPLTSNQPFETRQQFAGLIAAHFPNDIRLSNGGVIVRIYKPCDVIDVGRDDAYHHHQVTASWEAWA